VFEWIINYFQVDVIFPEDSASALISKECRDSYIRQYSVYEIEQYIK